MTESRMNVRTLIHGNGTARRILLFGHLRQQGQVTSYRGPGGGYTLSRGTEAITVADIVNAIEGAPPKVMIRRTLAT
jgi:DNA-binding IscR family transcriptional regulator